MQVEKDRASHASADWQGLYSGAAVSSAGTMTRNAGGGRGTATEELQ